MIQGKLIDVHEDGMAVVSFYPPYKLMKAMGFGDMHELNDAVKEKTIAKYPGFADKKVAQFDPESAGTMVYCATKEIAIEVEKMFFEAIKVGLDNLEIIRKFS